MLCSPYSMLSSQDSVTRNEIGNKVNLINLLGSLFSFNSLLFLICLYKIVSSSLSTLQEEGNCQNRDQLLHNLER